MTATAAGGTHPTGMHSCLVSNDTVVYGWTSTTHSHTVIIVLTNCTVTARQRGCGNVVFSVMSVWQSVHRGGSPSEQV